MRIEHELIIDADIETVWSLTVDVERWPELTPTMTSVERLDPGPFGLGSRARIVQPKQRPRVWTVTRFEAHRCFEWQAKLGTVTMTGGHLLEEVEHGATRNRLSLELTGVGSRLLGMVAGRQLAAAIATENDGFARAALAARPSGSAQAGGSTT